MQLLQEVQLFLRERMEGKQSRKSKRESKKELQVQVYKEG